VWHLWLLPLRAYALFIIVGIVAALLIGDRRWVARGGEQGVIYDIALVAVPCGLIGGRLYHVITDWRTYFAEGGAGLIGALRIWDGGLGIWGAVALGGVGAWWSCRRKGIPLPAFGDAIAPGIILAQAIGRLGNYFNQELYGRPTTLPWGLEIYERRNASGVLDSLNGVSTGQLVEVVHPTFLYELLWNLLVFAALIWIDRRFRVGHGRLFAMYVAGYCLGRFWVELMRSDLATHIAGIRINSFTSTFVFVGAVVYIMVAPKGREDPASLRGKHKEADEDAGVEEFVKELLPVGATTGVVAAAKAAGEVEDEDAKAVGGDGEPDTQSVAADSEDAEGAAEAEDLGADVAGVPADNLAEAEQFAAEGEEDGEPESEAAAEAEALAEDVQKAPAEDIAEAAEFAEAGEKADREAGVGSIEPEEAADAEAAAAEVHHDAVEAADEAADVAAETETEEPEPETEESETETEESETETEEPEPVAGVGAVEGEEAAEAQAAASEAHEAAVQAADEAADVAAETETAEPETEDAEAAVEEAAAEHSEAADEAVVDEADSAVDDEPRTGVLEARTESAATPDQEQPDEQSGGRLRRWLRRNR
jgi:prolipoprotein diacylglyceryl transferase